MINKRYQVFVSSTYTDLMDERAEIMQALLELDCMPAGMELFPAANEQQWNWIKKVIDESDYYLVVVGGRYGTISTVTGMSYTEMEYRYAIDTGKPVIAFLHDAPARIESGKTESAAQARKKLEQFRKLTEQRLCKYWNGPADLGAKVSRSITQLIKHQPAPGWVRADEIPTDRSHEVLDLRKRIGELEEKLRQVGLEEPVGIDELSKGQDTFSIDFSFETKNPKPGKNGTTYWVKGNQLDHSLETTWDGLFAFLAPELITPVAEYQVMSRLNAYIDKLGDEYFYKTFPDNKIRFVRIYSNSFDTIKIQLRALKLISIEEGDRWVLSPYGDTYMTKLLAVRKA